MRAALPARGSCSFNLLRPISTSATLQSSKKHKSPSLGDVTPQSVTAYKSNLNTYREKVKAAAAKEAAAEAERLAANNPGTGMLQSFPFLP